MTAFSRTLRLLSAMVAVSGLGMLTLMAQGGSNFAIGVKLNISIATVKFHVRNIFSKLGAKNRSEAVTLAWQHKLIEKP